MYDCNETELALQALGFFSFKILLEFEQAEAQVKSEPI